MENINPNDLFVYDEESPSKLAWKVNRWGGKNYASLVIPAGTHAGTLNKINHMWHVQFRGSPKPVHRILWEMFYNETDVIVTHKDGNPSNNTLSNLQSRPSVNVSVAADAADRDAWDEIFYLDSSSPSGLKWKIDNYTGYMGTVLKARKDEDVYQFQDAEGYWCVSIGRRSRHSAKVHKITYELKFGKIPDGLMVDHFNGDNSDNSENNLRLVTLHGNARNRKLTSRNTTGVNGVNMRVIKGRKYYRATWSCLITGKSLEKSFSVKKHGDEVAFQLACDFRIKMIKELNAQGAGYTERHGSEFIPTVHN